MRLTLRTMLAYLDDVLDAGDAQELGHKIEESSFASGLVHRIRDSTRRLRLGAPKVDAKGMGGDANSVAEYLDSTLDPERVPDFEKVCLESDVQLAEVASCHQVLTLVLGEPAQVPPAMRNRIYRIGHGDTSKPTPPSGNGFSSIDEEAINEGAEPPAVGPGPAAAQPATVVPPPTSQLPLKSLAITLLLGFLAALIVLQVIGVENLRRMVGLRSATPVVQSPVVEQPAEPQRPSPVSVEETQPETPRPSPMNTSAEPTSSEAPLPIPQTASPIPVTDDTEIPRPEAAPTPAPVTESPVPSVERPAEVGSERPTESPKGDVASDIVESPVSKSPAAVAELAAAPQVPVGRYISEQQVLLKFDSKRADWIRIASASPLMSNDRLLTLPTYRPQLHVAPGITVTLSGESHLTLDGSDDPAMPRLLITAGRAIMVPVGDPGVSAQLDLAGRTGALSFADAESIAAIEVRYYLTPGADPQADPGKRVIEIFALSGQVGWQPDEGDVRTINAGQVLASVGEGEASLFQAGSFPSWVDGGDLRDIDRLASIELRGHLAPDRPLTLSLMELTQFRRVDVRALANRSLCALDLFDPAIEALEDESQHSYWYLHFDALQASAARSPQSATKLLAALEKIANEDAASMYRMLCGYSPEGLAAGEAKELVGHLESERMAVRVLAYENLRRITGKTQQFRPEQPVSQGKSKVVKWERNLQDGGIVYQHLPSPLAKREPVSDAVSADAATPDSGKPPVSSPME